MKSFKLITAIAFICLIAVYSCQKSQVKPATQSASIDVVAAQIALSLSKSFNGQYGGTNISSGIKSPYAVANKGVAINGIYDLCGTGTDTTLNKTVLSHDTTIFNSGHFKFVYTCGAAGVDGYNVADSLTTATGNTAFYNTYSVAQNYIVKALDQTYKNISIDGSISTNSHISTISAGTTTEYHDLVSHYIFNGVTADVSGLVGDFKTGTASYTTVQKDYAAIYGSAVSTNTYHGLITYSPGHMCTITIQINSQNDTKTYSVNMLTGAIVAI